MMHAPLFALGISLLATLVPAQDANITSIDIPSNSTIEAGQGFDIGVQYDISAGFTYDGRAGSIELLAGPKGSPESNVVDIVCDAAPVSGFQCFYTFPKSLPAGPYHWRANITNDTVAPGLSDTFQVTPTTFQCATPDPWKNITSLADAHYSSLIWQGPYAGDVHPMDTAKDGSLVVSWTYRDGRNTADPNGTISNMTMELVNSKTGTVAGTQPMDPSLVVANVWEYANTRITYGGWRLRMNYTNQFEGSPLGTPVSASSEVFIISSGNSCPVGFTANGTGGKSGNGGFGSYERTMNASRLLALFGLIGYLL